MRLRRTAPGRTTSGRTTSGRTTSGRTESDGTGKAAAGRHRSPAGEPQGADLTPDQELESYLDAISPARDPESTDPGRRFGSAKVYQLRLPSGAEEQVQWLAEQYGTSPLRLLQAWVLQRLHYEFGGEVGGPGNAPQR
ncbi:MAG: hypothetical protein ACRDSL_03555 [Pseudonocardiaceae bacterium]